MTKEERKQLILAIWDKLGTVLGWTETGWQKTITKEDCADEILSIPLDVPTNEELAIEIVARYISCNNQYRKSKIKPILQKAFIDGAEWAIDEIKKRNQK